jgi:RNA polymerase sigma-70 factor, ECF subfamily
LHQTESELVLRLCQGDEKAFEELYNSHKRQVWLYCLKIVGDKDLASDIFQETFIRVHEKIAGFRGTGSLSGWIFRIARNLCYDSLRRTRKHHSVEEVEDLASPTNSYETVDHREELRKALDALKPEQREIIILREIQGFSYQDIAGLTGVSLASVKVRLFRAREKLRIALKALG